MPFKYKSQYREYQKAYQAMYYQNNKNGILARNKGWVKRNPAQKLGMHLKKKYGLSIEAYNLLLCSQRGKCAICNKPETRSFNGKTMRMAVDHCHNTGEVRALLCHKCNSAIGLLGDNIETLRSAINYLGERP